MLEKTGDTLGYRIIYKKLNTHETKNQQTLWIIWTQKNDVRHQTGSRHTSNNLCSRRTRKENASTITNKERKCDHSKSWKVVIKRCKVSCFRGTTCGRDWRGKSGGRWKVEAVEKPDVALGSARDIAQDAWTLLLPDDLSRTAAISTKHFKNQQHENTVKYAPSNQHPWSSRNAWPAASFELHFT